MNKILTLVLFFFISVQCFAQIENFDSAYVFASSNEYDYHNLSFEHPSFFDLDSANMVYERSNGSSSNIISRRARGIINRNEIVITNDNFMNIHPATSRTMIVWQSNKYGNFDIFFSTYSGGVWSSPIICDTSSSTIESYPLVVESHFANPSYQCIVYLKNNDVILCTYSNGVKFLDTNITLTDVNPASNPVLSLRSNSLTLAYLSESSPGFNKLIIKRGSLNSAGSLTWSSNTVVEQMNSVSNLKYSMDYSAGQINYDYDTLGSKHCMARDIGSSFRDLFSKKYTGSNNYGGEGTLYPVITDAGFYYMAFAWHRKTSDSSMIMAFKSFQNTLNSIPKRFYLGDSSVNTRTAMSFPLVSNYLRVKLIWEKLINGKWALIESRASDFSTGIISSSNNIPEKFALHQNYPNPFNPSTKIRFDIPKSSFVTLAIHDITGREVSKLLSQNITAGTYEYEFDGADLSSGLYFYNLTFENTTVIKKMVLLK